MSATKIVSENEGFKRFVQVGRVVYLTAGPNAGSLATIVEIVDHNRALIDGPATKVPRQVLSYSNMTLTPYVVPSLPRSAGSTAVAKAWEKSGVQAKWDSSSWAKKLAARKTRASLSDFDRFNAMLLKKQRRSAVRVQSAKA